MRRGTTPTNIFTVDADLRGAAVVYITYQQSGRTVIEKALADLTVEEEQITVELTQAETLMLREGKTVDIQIRARFPDGRAVASDIMTVPVDAILKEGAI